MYVIILVLALFSFIIGFAIYKLFKSKKRWAKYTAWVICGLLFCLAGTVYTGLYPLESFYIEEWTRNTGLDFPESARFIWKDATYPDQHGDYTSHAVIELSEEEYASLKQTIESSNSFALDSDQLDFKGFISPSLPPEWNDVEKYSSIFHISIASSFKIGFRTDGKTITFQRHSS